jgi:diguanylate cyclase (GGDEF)-like protein
VRTREADDPDYAWPIQEEQSSETLARAEHLQLVISNGIYVLLGNLAAASVLVIGAWHRLPQLQVLVWFATMVAFNALRWTVGRRFPHRPLQDSEIRVWDRRLVISVLFSGVLWGFAGAFFFLPGEPGHNFFLALLVIGMAAAAAAPLSYHRFAYPAFFLPAVTPITLALITERGIAETAMGLVTPFYFLVMYLLSRKIFRTAHASILARLEQQRLAYYDHLTGVTNRRAFEEVLRKEWLRALRSQHPLSLVIADIDDFKKLNDRYGHHVGDQVLRAVAQMIEGRIRRGSDLAARVGGEEFAIILPETDLAGARTLAEQIRRGCEAIGPGSRPDHGAVTLSAGVSICVPSESVKLETLFRHADTALYQAKQRGKNRVVSVAAARSSPDRSGFEP